MMDDNTLAVVSVSGGKDSTATALLAIERLGIERCRFVYADTGNEHELTERYVREYLPTALGAQIDEVRSDFTALIAGRRDYVREKWPLKGVPQEIIDKALGVLHPTGVPFLDLCLWKGRFPSRKAQFCTQELKRYPLDAYLIERMNEGFAVESWRGIRRDESQNRSNAQPRERAAEGWDVVHPIVDWTAQQTVDYVLSKGVELNPLYSQGMGRVGCMPCINCRKDELAEIARRFPGHIDKIREWERLVSMAAKRGWTTFFTDALLEGESDEEIFNRLSIDKRVEWAKTSRGGKVFDIFKQDYGAPQCQSIYGLCE